MAAVARRLGVAPATLRTWARRYGLGPSAHVAGSHRRYTAEDVARLEVMRRLVMDGVPPAEAAEIVAAGGAVAPIGVGADPDREPAVPGVLPGGATRGTAVVIPLPERAPNQPAPTDPPPRHHGLLRAATTLDTGLTQRMLRDAVAAYGVVGAWTTMIMPVLQALGRRWETTGDGIDVEHAFAEATLGALRSVTSTLHHPRNIRPVLLACVDGERHTLPLHVLAAALAEVEIEARLLGSGMPLAHLTAAVRRTGPAVVLVYAHLPIAGEHLLPTGLRQRPAPRLLLGGPGWGSAQVPGAVRVTTLSEALDQTLAAVPLR